MYYKLIIEIINTKYINTAPSQYLKQEHHDAAVVIKVETLSKPIMNNYYQIITPVDLIKQCTLVSTIECANKMELVEILVENIDLMLINNLITSSLLRTELKALLNMIMLIPTDSFDIYIDEFLDKSNTDENGSVIKCNYRS